MIIPGEAIYNYAATTKRVQRANFSSFAFTYKINAKINDVSTIDEAKYQPVFQAIEKQKGKVNHYVYEKDEKGLLHIHGVAELPKRIRYTSLTVKGYTSRWKEVYNLAGWLDYMRKDQKLKEAVNFETSIEPKEEDFLNEPEQYIVPSKPLFK